MTTLRVYLDTVITSGRVSRDPRDLNPPEEMAAVEDASCVDGYLKDGWKKQYVRLLLECEETKIERLVSRCPEAGVPLLGNPSPMSPAPPLPLQTIRI